MLRKLICKCNLDIERQLNDEKRKRRKLVEVCCLQHIIVQKSVELAHTKSDRSENSRINHFLTMVLNTQDNICIIKRRSLAVRYIVP